MALATQCPHCQTTFRVAHDQLKLRAGLVRCGACKQIFNGIENLLRPEQQVRPVAPPTAPETQPSPSATNSAPDLRSNPNANPAALATRAEPASTEGGGDSPAKASSVDFYLPQEEEPSTPATPGRPGQPEDVVEAESAPDSDADPESGEAMTRQSPESAAAPDSPASSGHEEQEQEDPMLRMTLMDFSDHDADQPGQAGWQDDRPDPLDQAMEALERKPLRASSEVTTGLAGPADSISDVEDATDADYEEPSFVRQGRRRQRRGRATRALMSIGSMLLLIGLLLQGAYVFRDQLAARFPQTKPLLLEACAYLECQVDLPAQIEAVSIESSELQTLAPNSNTLGLSILLRNHSAIAQAWPHIELTLNDAGEKALVRRVFPPAEYLPPDMNPRPGFPSQSEQPVRLYFELDDVKASGYRVYVFYP